MKHKKIFVLTLFIMFAAVAMVEIDRLVGIDLRTFGTTAHFTHIVAYTFPSYVLAMIVCRWNPQ